MTTNFYIFHGEDDLGIDEAVGNLREGMGENADLNTSEFDGAASSPAEVLGAVSSFPFLSDKRLVIVRGMLSCLTRRGAGQTGKDGIRLLADNLLGLPEYARLVFVERQQLNNNHAIVKLAQGADNGYIKNFSTPQDMTGWIMKRTREVYEREIDNRAATALAAVIANDLRRADNELIKLVSYVEEGQPIAEDDVAVLTPYVPEANIFKMVDAIGDGRGQVALQLLHRLMSDKNQDPFSLYGMIVRQFRLLLMVKEHLATGGSPGSVAKAVGVRPFIAQNLARQSRGFNLDDLERIYRNLQDTDFKMKTGQIPPNLALDLFVASIAR